MPGSLEQIVDDIEDLQGILRTIETDLEEMKRKARAGQNIPPAELEMAVKDIDRLKKLMDERSINGH